MKKENKSLSEKDLRNVNLIKESIKKSKKTYDLRDMRKTTGEK